MPISVVFVYYASILWLFAPQDVSFGKQQSLFQDTERVAFAEDKLDFSIIEISSLVPKMNIP